MHRHDKPTHQLRRPEVDSRSIESLENRSIYAFIVEVKQAANYTIERELPVIALCDAESRTNWISLDFVEDLERAGSEISTAFKSSSFRRPKRRKESEAPRITIRWTCGKLNQYSVEGTFVIEPKAQFKILFGCGYPFNPRPQERTRITDFSRFYSSAKGKNIQSGQPLSEKVAAGFRQGIEDGTLLRLKRMPPLSENFVSIADLEVELEYLSASYSFTDQALNSDFVYDDTSSYLVSSAGDLPIETRFMHGSEIEHYTYTESANTSISDSSYRGHSLTEMLRHERGGSHPSYNVEGWFAQDVCEEPINSRMIRPRQNRFSLNLINNPNPKELEALAAARAASQKASSDYWTWDGEAKNYKHYDEGSAEPVWYNPP